MSTESEDSQPQDSYDYNPPVASFRALDIPSAQSRPIPETPPNAGDETETPSENPAEPHDPRWQQSTEATVVFDTAQFIAQGIGTYNTVDTKSIPIISPATIDPSRLGIRGALPTHTNTPGTESGSFSRITNRYNSTSTNKIRSLTSPGTTPSDTPPSPHHQHSPTPENTQTHEPTPPAESFASDPEHTPQRATQPSGHPQADEYGEQAEDFPVAVPPIPYDDEPITSVVRVPLSSPLITPRPADAHLSSAGETPAPVEDTPTDQTSTETDSTSHTPQISPSPDPVPDSLNHRTAHEESTGQAGKEHVITPAQSAPAVTPEVVQPQSTADAASEVSAFKKLFIIDHQVMENLADKANKYRPLLVSVDHLLPESASPTYITEKNEAITPGTLPEKQDKSHGDALLNSPDEVTRTPPEPRYPTAPEYILDDVDDEIIVPPAGLPTDSSDIAHPSDSYFASSTAEKKTEEADGDGISDNDSSPPSSGAILQKHFHEVPFSTGREPVVVPATKPKNPAPVSHGLLHQCVSALGILSLITASLIVLMNVYIPTANFVNGTVLGINIGEKANYTSNIFNTGIVTLIPPSLIGPSDALLLIFSYTFFLCVTLVVARYVVLSFGARIVFLISSLFYAIIGYALYQVHQLSVVGILMGVWGTFGALVLVSSMYLLMRFNSVRNNSTPYRVQIAAIAILSVPIAVLVNAIIVTQLGSGSQYWVSAVAMGLMCIIIFNIGADYFHDEAVHEGKDLFGSFLIIVIISLCGWALIGGDYVNIFTTQKAGIYGVAGIVVVILVFYELTSRRGFFDFYRVNVGLVPSFLRFTLALISSFLWSFVFFIIVLYIYTQTHPTLVRLSLNMLPAIGGVLLGILFFSVTYSRFANSAYRFLGFACITIATLITIQLPYHSGGHFIQALSVAEVILFLGATLINADLVTIIPSHANKLLTKLGLFWMNLTGMILGLILPALYIVLYRDDILYNSFHKGTEVAPITFSIGGNTITGETLVHYRIDETIQHCVVPIIVAVCVGIVTVVLTNIIQPRNAKLNTTKNVFNEK